MLRKLMLLVALCAVVFVGLPNLPAAAHSEGPHLRVAHLAPTAPAVDIYVNDKIAFSGAKFKDVTAYASLDGWEFKVVVVPAGGTLADSVTKAPIMLRFKEGDNGYYTAAAVGSLADGTFEVVLLPADGAPAKMAMDGGASGDVTAGNIEIKGAFARPTKAGEMGGHSGHGGMGGMQGGVSGVSAAYMTIRNTGDKADRLLSAASDVAGKVEIHETIVENDVAKMVAQPNGFEVPAGSTLELKPGGKHIMLLELKKDLVAGDTIMLRLTFESGLIVTLAVPVRQP